MYAEILDLEIQAKKAGLTVVKPPMLKGVSGVEHLFSFIGSSGRSNYAIDVYEQVTEMEVLRSYIKQVDTKAIASVVSSTGKSNDAALRLAKEYGMKILTRPELISLFDQVLLKKPNGR